MANLGIVAVVTTLVVLILTYGVPLFLKEYFPWQSLYKQRHGRPTVTTKSYKGRTALITGANGAFGSRAAKIFAQRDVETLVLVDVRDCSGVKEEIEKELGEAGKPVPKILVWQADLMTFKGCQELGRKAKDLEHLDHVLMTAGILAFNRRESPEGWETSIQGSYLKKLSNNKEGMEQAHQYGRSKGLLLYWARELASRVSAIQATEKLPRKVTINSADPGSAWTPLTNPNQAKLIPRLIMNFGARDPQICATALVNGVSATEDAHGKIMQDFDTADYPPFMVRKSGRAAQARVWEETREELEAKVPEVKAIFDMLDQ
ncbi:Short-chain dehydrogenase/reductase SDR [Fusarium oxysporum f. sp. vasinfectum]|nr:Short-chain dehydrogenase/reductase SDR [Fusarium oxysporum f. sp. vasinfectum]KAK2931687.1 Short-chain dehydrogenase/reductase SDR [Fusarium oxysporum f. sp. vasinfectum]WKT51800.1 Short-chain dehydrogenase/reductase SDR [Fusarium oxysporum f. sp. vasinfectum]